MFHDFMYGYKEVNCQCLPRGGVSGVGLGVYVYVCMCVGVGVCIYIRMCVCQFV